MKRNEASVVKSMVKKGWFVDEDKNIDSKFPMIVNSNKFFPYWLDKKFFKIWHTLNQKEKCYLCVYTMNLHSKKIRKKIEVRYEDLLENPNKEVNLLKKKLKLSSTNKTIKILSSIKNNKKEIYLKDLDIRAKLLDRFK